MSDEDLARAVKLVEAGMAILPLIGKAPDPDLAPCGVYSAIKDLQCIEDWLRERRNIGATVANSGLLYIDVDPRHGGKVHSLKLTWTERTWAWHTGRGDGGAHILYRVPDGVTLGEIDKKALGPGIDILGPRLYGVIPPSIHPDTGNPHYWATGCSPLDIELAEAPPHLIARLQQRDDAEPEDFIEEETCLEEIISALPWIDAEPYFTWLRVGLALKRALGDTAEGWTLFDLWSRQAYKGNIPRQ